MDSHGKEKVKTYEAGSAGRDELGLLRTEKYDRGVKTIHLERHHCSGEKGSYVRILK